MFQKHKKPRSNLKPQEKKAVPVCVFWCLIFTDGEGDTSEVQYRVMVKIESSGVTLSGF